MTVESATASTMAVVEMSEMTGRAAMAVAKRMIDVMKRIVKIDLVDLMVGS